MFHILGLILILKQQFIRFSFIKLTNGTNQTNYDQKSNFLLLQSHYQSQKFWAKLVKNWQKTLQVNEYSLHWNITIKNIDDCESISSVNPLYLRINHASGYIEEKNGNKYLVFDSTDRNKELLKKFSDF